MLSETQQSRDSTEELLKTGIERLQAVLPATWKLTRSHEGTRVTTGVADALVVVQGGAPGASSQILVEARTSLTPRGVGLLTAGPWQLLMQQQRTPMLLVAPTLTARTRARLRESGINYLALNGATWITLETPGLHVELEGERMGSTVGRSPVPALRGARAGRLLRLLVDIRPPYGVGEIASAAGLSQAYVSRLVGAVDTEALLERGRRGQVVAVDWVGVLRRWAEVYSLLKTHQLQGAIARQGIGALLDQLRGESGNWVITGSYGARRLAPVAAPALLAIYTDSPQGMFERLGLMPVPDGYDVVLLRPSDEYVYSRMETEDGLRYAAPSQLALDCLTGPGRMPAEGEAVLGWMEEHEARWRAVSLDRLGPGRAAR